MGKLKVYSSMTTTNNSPSQDYTHLDNQSTLSHSTPKETGIWTTWHLLKFDLSLLQERTVLCILVQFLLVNRLMMAVVWRKSVLWKISWKLLKNLQGSIRRYMARVYPGNHCIYTSSFCPAMVDVSVSSQQPRETECKIIVRLVRDCCTLLRIQKQRMWYWQKLSLIITTCAANRWRSF